MVCGFWFDNTLTILSPGSVDLVILGAELSPGQSCQVNCLAPFEGPGFEARLGTRFSKENYEKVHEYFHFQNFINRGFWELLIKLRLAGVLLERNQRQIVSWQSTPSWKILRWILDRAPPKLKQKRSQTLILNLVLCFFLVSPPTAECQIDAKSTSSSGHHRTAVDARWGAQPTIRCRRVPWLQMRKPFVFLVPRCGPRVHSNEKNSGKVITSFFWTWYYHRYDSWYLLVHEEVSNFGCFVADPWYFPNKYLQVRRSECLSPTARCPVLCRSPFLMAIPMPVANGAATKVLGDRIFPRFPCKFFGCGGCRLLFW